MPQSRDEAKAAQSEEAAAARRRAKNAKKASKRACKRAERREEERRQREEEEAAARAHQAYVAAAETRHQEAKAANDPNSRSNVLRASANKLYNGLEGLSPVLISSHLSRTEGMYKDALVTATTPLERCSAAKNLAVLAKRTLWLMRADGPTALRLQADALKYYVTALINGSDCQTIAWVDDVFSAATELVDTALNWRDSDLVAERPFLADRWPDQGAVLSRLHSVLPLDSGSSERSGHVASLKASLSLSLAKHMYAEAVYIQESGDTEQQWRRALDIVGRAQPLFAAAAQEAWRCGDRSLAEEAEALMEAADICEHICRSVQARHVASTMLKRVLDDSESLDMEGVRLVTDFLKEAISYARDHDLESEARAHVALGNLYSKVLRNQERGLSHYKLVLELGVAMMPRVVSHTDWYQEARQAVLAAQEALKAAEEAAEKAARAPYMEELAEVLAELKKAADKGANHLLQHIYEKHPVPGTQPTKLPFSAVCGDNIKDTLRKAVIAYHPDKQVAHPRKWQVLAGEITKELNNKYGCMK